MRLPRSVRIVSEERCEKIQQKAEKKKEGKRDGERERKCPREEEKSHQPPSKERDRF